MKNEHERAPALLLALVILVTLGAETFACLKREKEKPVNPVFRNRMRTISTAAPFATELNKQQDAKDAIVILTDLLAYESAQHRKASFDWEYGKTEMSNPCNQELCRVISTSVNNSLAKRGFGHFRIPCITENPVTLTLRAKDALLTYLQAVGSAGNGVLHALRSKVPGKFKHGSFIFSKFQYHDTVAKCTLHHLTAFYVNDTWALSADITNAPVSAEKPDQHRLYLAENVYVSPEKRVRALPMNIRGTVGTTSLSAWGGAPATSRFFFALPPGRNPAVLDGLRLRQEERGQAEDALMGSNIAIMSLPLASALLPIAIFADVARFTAIAYLLITDIAAMLPLAIKGMELIAFSQGESDATRLRLYDVLDTKMIGAAELWHAKCTAQNHLLLKGAIFLCLSLMLMVVGIVLEIVAQRVLWKKKKEFHSVQRLHTKRPIPQMWERHGSNIGCVHCKMKEASGAKWTDGPERFYDEYDYYYYN